MTRLFGDPLRLSVHVVVSPRLRMTLRHCPDATVRRVSCILAHLLRFYCLLLFGIHSIVLLYCSYCFTSIPKRSVVYYKYCLYVTSSFRTRIDYVDPEVFLCAQSLVFSSYSRYSRLSSSPGVVLAGRLILRHPGLTSDPHDFLFVTVQPIT